MVYKIIKKWGPAIGLLVSVMAIVISLYALRISELQLDESRRGTQLQNQASLGFDIDTDTTQRRLGIAVTNAGPGVATIRAVAYFVDRKPIKEMNEALTAAHLDPDVDYGVDFLPGDPIAAGATTWLLDYRSKKRDERDRASEFIENHLTVAVQYCSADGRCKTVCSDSEVGCGPAPANSR
jgi:hypothetical protein